MGFLVPVDVLVLNNCQIHSGKENDELEDWLWERFAIIIHFYFHCYPNCKLDKVVISILSDCTSYLYVRVDYFQNWYYCVDSLSNTADC